MQTQIRRYNIVVKGRVQDIGFRDYVIALANMVKIRGYIFNDIDGSVRMILEGVKETVNNFLSEIKSSKDIAGVEIESLQQREIAGDFDIPVRFVKLSTDEMYDIDRKLGIGNDYLKEIKHDTSVLPDVKKGIDTLNTNFDLYITEQKEHNKCMDEHNQWMKNHSIKMDEHNQRLEKILEKLAER